MWLILQQDKAEDYVIATGETTEIREFVRMSFNHMGVSLDFKGEGVDEVGFVSSVDSEKFLKTVGRNAELKVGDEVVFVDPQYFRPTEVDLLIGDPTKSQTQLGWKPKYNLAGLVEDMMSSDLKLMTKQTYLKEGGFETKNYYE